MEAWLTFWEFAGSVANFLAKSGELYCHQQLAATSDRFIDYFWGCWRLFSCFGDWRESTYCSAVSVANEQRALLWALPRYEALTGGQDLPQQPQM